MTIAQDPIKNAIWRFLNHYAYKDALFLAERLYAEVSSDEALFLLATSYYRLGKPKIVQVLFEKHGLHQPQCKLLYAQACWDLEDYAKAEQVLIGGSMKLRCIFNVFTTFQAEYGDSACFAITLLGRIYQQTERMDWAEKCFTKSLHLNPFLWTSFEKICEAGGKPNPDELFNLSSLHNVGDYKLVHTTPVNASVAQTPQSTQLRKKKSNAVKVLAPSQVGSNVEHVDVTVSSASPQRTPQLNVPTTGAPLRIVEENRSSIDRKNSPHSDSTYLRSTPAESTQWDSSMDSYTGSQPTDRRFTRTQLRISRSLMGGTANLSPLTPSFGVTPLYGTPSPVWDRTIANTTPTDMVPPPHEINPPVKKMITRQSRKLGDTTTTAGKLFFSSENNRRETNPAHISNSDSTSQNQAPTTRRSTRFSNSNNSVKENAKKSSKSKSVQSKDILNKKNTRIRTKQTNSDMPVRDLSEEISKVDCSGEKVKGHALSVTNSHLVSLQKDAVDRLLKLLQNMGNALLQLCQYDCAKAVSLIEGLPPHQRNTSWSLSLLARGYFEMTEYKKAASVFEELRRNHGHHVTGLSLYSTTLWHLRDSVALSTLAHDLISLDSLSPETWCAVGNCFSLRRDNESAVKFFTRAVQLAPHYAYAHTLLGHEYAYTDDNERAMACFRKAIHCDSRHYNAWYGMGTIYYKQENFSLAEIHYKKAISIYPRSSVLLCHLGMVQHAQKRSGAALNTLSRALALEPRNPLCMFHRASILFATEKHAEALKELLQLKQLVPKESLVYFLIGKAYKILGENHLAMMNFSWALDLDPRGINNHIKEAIDKQQTNDENTFDDSQASQSFDEGSNNSGGEFMDSASPDEVFTEHEEAMQDSDESL